MATERLQTTYGTPSPDFLTNALQLTADKHPDPASSSPSRCPPSSTIWRRPCAGRGCGRCPYAGAGAAGPSSSCCAARPDPACRCAPC
ncbi:hypothetical protein ACRAWF_39695 [Streptomyces sp. L7]